MKVAYDPLLTEEKTTARDSNVHAESSDFLNHRQTGAVLITKGPQFVKAGESGLSFSIPALLN